MPLVQTSPRVRRRLLRALVVAIIGAGIALAALVIPNHSGRTTQHFHAGKPYIVKVQKQVPVGSRDRAAIDRLLDRFVADAVARRDPGAAYGLATASLRAGTTRADWTGGSLPVQPLQVRGSTFHGWSPSYSYRNEVNFDLLVHAKPGSEIGARLAANLLVVGVLPAFSAVGIAAGQFAGEKERGLLTPLLASPAKRPKPRPRERNISPSWLQTRPSSAMTIFLKSRSTWKTQSACCVC